VTGLGARELLEQLLECGIADRGGVLAVELDRRLLALEVGREGAECPGVPTSRCSVSLRLSASQ
jgi:hypothetical protein